MINSSLGLLDITRYHLVPRANDDDDNTPYSLFIRAFWWDSKREKTGSEGFFFIVWFFASEKNKNKLCYNIDGQQ